MGKNLIIRKQIIYRSKYNNIINNYLFYRLYENRIIRINIIRAFLINNYSKQRLSFDTCFTIQATISPLSPSLHPLPVRWSSTKKTCIAAADIVAWTTSGRGESESLRSSATKKGGGGETEKEGGKVT